MSSRQSLKCGVAQVFFPIFDLIAGKLSLRKDTRTALLTSKRAIDSRSKSNRDELLAFSSSQEILNEKSTYVRYPLYFLWFQKNLLFSDDSLMKANADVTDALRRTIHLMQTELESSVLSTQLLDSSTVNLRSTSLQHDVLSSVMSTSKQLVTALEKSDWLDRMVILSAFAFFILVVLFIVNQRILDKGLRLAFWWTRYLPSFKHDAAILQTGMETVKE